MKKSKAARMMKEARMQRGKTQQQLSMDMFQSREYVAKQENGDRKLTPSTVQHFTETYNDPWLALEAAFEYTGWGVTRLDGPAVDLHRSAVREKTLEELREAIEAMEKVKLTKHPSFTQSFELQDIERSAREHIDVIGASMTYVATLCQEYGLNWNQLWEDHHRKLQSRGYVTS
ncbi:helix-turn-helix domain-containing protein [Halobacillus sp. BAB-2008]|uniref:helix-turn-helix domain-containing protein n=1 Tax=Halobacillus sp. BAB-2008 TaxID=1246484 RepID=UPI0002A4DAAC|nr:helix-turn-helix domain-containing protein [Halobacillus sp. BAB-2008]ELK47215.1 bacteriophage-related protein [Halobacillus sp. BAB-2008]